MKLNIFLYFFVYDYITLNRLAVSLFLGTNAVMCFVVKKSLCTFGFEALKCLAFSSSLYNLMFL